MHYNKKVEGVTERLIEAIKESGMSTQEICKTGKIPRSTYYNHLSGDSLSERYIVKYCRVLNISADWLLGLTCEKRRVKK